VASSYERLRRPQPADAAVTIRHDGTGVDVCRGTACTHLVIPESDGGAVEVNEDGSLVVVYAKAAAVYDVATGKRVAKLSERAIWGDLEHLGLDIELLGARALLVTRTPCAGPCSTSVLFDARTGKKLADVGGTNEFGVGMNASALSPAQVRGDVWAFNDSDTPAIVLQDVRTGKIVRRFDRPVDCTGDCALRMVHMATGLALLPGRGAAGDVTLLDPRGDVTASYHLPLCK
jgi:hypothetical protein